MRAPALDLLCGATPMRSCGTRTMPTLALDLLSGATPAMTSVKTASSSSLSVPSHATAPSPASLSSRSAQE